MSVKSVYLVGLLRVMCRVSSIFFLLSCFAFDTITCSMIDHCFCYLLLLPSENVDQIDIVPTCDINRTFFHSRSSTRVDE